MRSGELGRQGVWATGFMGIRLTWASRPRSSSGQRRGVGGRVVDAVDHHELVRDAPAGRLGVPVGRGHDLADRASAG